MRTDPTRTGAVAQNAGSTWNAGGTAPPEDRTAGVTMQYKTLEGNVRQMEVKIPRLAAGAAARAIVTFEVTRTVQHPPQHVDGLVIADAAVGRLLDRLPGAPRPRCEKWIRPEET